MGLSPNEFGVNLIDVTTQDRRQIGIHDGGVAPADELHEWNSFVRHRDLTKADVTGDVSDPLLMLMMSVPVHEHDGHRLDAVVVGRGQALTSHLFVKRPHHLAMSTNTLGDLGNRFMKQLG